MRIPPLPHHALATTPGRCQPETPKRRVNGASPPIHSANACPCCPFPSCGAKTLHLQPRQGTDLSSLFVPLPHPSRAPNDPIPHQAPTLQSNRRRRVVANAHPDISSDNRASKSGWPVSFIGLPFRWFAVAMTLFIITWQVLRSGKRSDNGL